MDNELFKFIKTRQFTFCSRCGENCRIGGEEFMCTSCKASLFGRNESLMEKRERKLKEETESQISETVTQYRQDLAILRRNNGRK